MTIRFRAALLRHDLDRLVVEPLRWRLVFSLPRAVVYWVTVRAVAEGVRRDEVMGDVPATEIVRRWSTRARYRAERARRRSRRLERTEKRGAHDRLVAPLLRDRTTTSRLRVRVEMPRVADPKGPHPTSIPAVIAERRRGEQDRTAAAWIAAWTAAVNR